MSQKLLSIPKQSQKKVNTSKELNKDNFLDYPKRKSLLPQVLQFKKVKKEEVLGQKADQKLQQVVNFDGSDMEDDDWDEDSNAADSEEPADNENFEFDDEDWDAL